MTATKHHRRRAVLWTVAVLAGLVALVVLWNAAESLIAGEVSGGGAYLVTSLLIFGDALCPILPGETTLNAATILAVNGKLDLWLVVLAGAIGAITGDSAVYWLARRSKGRVRAKLDAAGASKTGQQVVEQLRIRGSVFLLFGRYIPGMRFGLNVALGGVVKMPYRKFLFWSAMSGTLWAFYTCTCAYFVSTALLGYPLMSLVVTMVVSMGLIACIIWLQTKLSHRKSEEETELPQPMVSG